MSKPANVRTLLWVATSVILAASASPALAAGYDTPILYTARHMGMGGTAIASSRARSSPRAIVVPSGAL